MHGTRKLDLLVAASSLAVITARVGTTQLPMAAALGATTATVLANKVLLHKLGLHEHKGAKLFTDVLDTFVGSTIFVASFSAFVAPVTTALSNPEAASISAWLVNHAIDNDMARIFAEKAVVVVTTVGAENIAKAFAIGLIPFVSLGAISTITGEYAKGDEAENDKAGMPALRMALFGFTSQLLKYYLSPAEFALTSSSMISFALAGGACYATYAALDNAGFGAPNYKGMQKVFNASFVGAYNYVTYQLADVAFPNVPNDLVYSALAGAIESGEVVLKATIVPLAVMLEDKIFSCCSSSPAATAIAA